MISERRLRQELKTALKFERAINKSNPNNYLIDEIRGYIDGLTYALKGELS